MSRDQNVAMDFLGLEKASTKHEQETDVSSVSSHTKHDSVSNDDMRNSTVFASAFSEVNRPNSVNGQAVKSDFTQAFGLFSKYFRERGNATAAMGLNDTFLGKPLEPRGNDDVKGSKPSGDDNVPTQLGLFPQQTGFGTLRSMSGIEQKIFAPMMAHPSACRGMMQGPNAQAMRSIVPPNSAMKPPAAQLTIFYAGMVNVYDDVPADKAQAIMLLAGSGNPHIPNSAKTANFSQQTACSAPPTTTPLSSIARSSLSLQTNGLNTDTPIPTMPLPGGPNQHRKLQADLPIARKHSLQRFLEKRRDRLITKAPYTTSGPKNTEGDEAALSAQSGAPSCGSPSATLACRAASGCCNENSAPPEASPSPVS